MQWVRANWGRNWRGLENVLSLLQRMKVWEDRGTSLYIGCQKNVVGILMLVDWNGLEDVCLIQSVQLLLCKDFYSLYVRDIVEACFLNLFFHIFFVSSFENLFIYIYSIERLSLIRNYC